MDEQESGENHDLLFLPPHQILIPKEIKKNWDEETTSFFNSFTVLEKSLDHLDYYRVSFLQIISFLNENFKIHKNSFSKEISSKGIFSVIEKLEEKIKINFPNEIKQQIKKYNDEAIESVKTNIKDNNLPIVKREQGNEQKNKEKNQQKKQEIILNSIQQHAYQKVICENKIYSGLISFPSGVGKTILTLKIALDFFDNGIFIVVPNDVLQSRWQDELIQKFGITKEDISFQFKNKEADKKIEKDKNKKQEKEKNIKQEKDKSNDKQKKITIITFNQFVKVKQDDSQDDLQNKVEIILIDEVHNLKIKELNYLEKIKAIKIGLSATCFFGDIELEKKVYHSIGAILYQSSDEFIKNEILYKMIKVQFDKEEQIHYLISKNKNQKYKIASLAKNKIIELGKILESHKQQKIIIFCHFQEQLKEVSKKYNCIAISSQSSIKKKTATYKDFNQNKINIFATTSISNEGVDIPEANVLIQLSSNRENSIEEKQRLGRLLRKKKDEKTKIYFYSLITANTVEESFSVERASHIENKII